jgi:hypothetical protein
MHKPFLVLFSMMLLFSGCSYPTTNVDAVDSRPTLCFKDAPNDALVFVDGLSMGKATAFNGNPKVLTVLPGTHEVQVILGTTVLLKQTVFVQSENKTFTIPKVGV